MFQGKGQQSLFVAFRAFPAAERAPDSRGERSAALAARSLQDPLAFLDLADVFTPPLRDSARFRDAFVDAAGSLAESGPLGAIERLQRAQ